MLIRPLSSRSASDNIPRADEIRTLVKETWDTRVAKLRLSADSFVRQQEAHAKVPASPVPAGCRVPRGRGGWRRRRAARGDAGWGRFFLGCGCVGWELRPLRRGCSRVLLGAGVQPGRALGVSPEEKRGLQSCCRVPRPLHSRAASPGSALFSFSWIT